MFISGQYNFSSYTEAFFFGIPYSPILDLTEKIPRTNSLAYFYLCLCQRKDFITSKTCHNFFFSSSLTMGWNKLECSPLESFMASSVIASKARGMNNIFPYRNKLEYLPLPFTSSLGSNVLKLCKAVSYACTLQAFPG